MKKPKDNQKKKSDNNSNIPPELLENLSFSDSTRQLEELKKLIFNSKQSRNNKIATIKQAIESNEYAISNIKIAEKLLEDLVIQEEQETELA